MLSIGFRRRAFTECKIKKKLHHSQAASQTNLPNLRIDPICVYRINILGVLSPFLIMYIPLGRLETCSGVTSVMTLLPDMV